MKILTDNERASLLTKLAEAPDDILLEAVARMKELYVHVKDDMKALNGFVGIRFTEAPKFTLPPEEKRPVLDTKEVVAAIDGAKAVAKNIEPPGPAAQRITTASKDAIMARLLKPGTVEEVNKFLARGQAKVPETAMLLRRLWDLGQVTYDGVNYGAKR